MSVQDRPQWDVVVRSPEYKEQGRQGPYWSEDEAARFEQMKRQQAQNRGWAVRITVERRLCPTSGRT